MYLLNTFLPIPLTEFVSARITWYSCFELCISYTHECIQMLLRTVLQLMKHIVILLESFQLDICTFILVK